MSCPTAGKQQLDPEHVTNFLGNCSSPSEGKCSVQTCSPVSLIGRLKLEPLVSARFGVRLNLTDRDSETKSSSLSDGEPDDDEGKLPSMPVQNASRASADKRKKKR